MTRRTFRGLLQNLLLVLISILVATVVIEIAIRMLYAEHVATVTSRSFWQHDSYLGWKNRSGETGTMFFPERKVGKQLISVVMNSAGFRDKERSSPPTPGKRRIACLGDSFVFGHGVEFDSLFTSLIETRDPRLEVLNFGVSAYSTDQELLLLEKVVLDYNPDVVLLFVTENDFEGNNSRVMFSYPKPKFILENGELELTNVPVVKIKGSHVFAVERFLLRHSALFSFVKFRIGYGSGIRAWLKKMLAPEKGAEKSKKVDLVTEKDKQKYREEHMAVTLALIDRYARLCRSGGAVPVVVLYPDVYPAPPAVKGYKAILAEYCENNDACQLIDLHPTFHESVQDQRLLFLSGDRRHWSTTGHRVAAERVTAELRSVLSLE